MSAADDRPPLAAPPRWADFGEVFLRHAGFRRLYLARNASLLGDWFNLLAVLALLRELNAADASTIGTLIILKLIPSALFGPVAGVVADRYSRKTIMLAADAARFLLVLSMFAAPFVGDHAVALLLLATFFQTAAAAFSEPARLATIPNLVPPRLLGAANALGAVTWSLMFTLGAGAGGLVTSLLGWRWALALDAGSYAVSFLLVVGIALPRRAFRRKPGDWMSALGLRDVSEALRYLRQNPHIATLLAGKSGWGLAGAISLLLTLFGERVYPVAGRPDLGIALLYMARGIGTALGPLLSRRLTREREGPLKVAIGASFLLAALAYGLFAIVDRVELALALVVVAHLGGSTIWVFTTLLMQRSVPDELRGRIFATDLGLATFTVSVLVWGYGRMADAGMALRPLMASQALILLVPALVWFLLTTWVARRFVRPSG